MEKYLSICAAVAYLISAVMPARLRTQVAVGTLVAWLFHGAALGAIVFMGGALPALRLGFAVMLSAALWISVLVYWLENRNFSLDSLRVLMLPCAGVSIILPLLFPGSVFSLSGQSPLFPWHVAIALLAYSTLTIAAFHAVVMALQDSRLHTRGKLSAGWFAVAIDRLPALMTMEKLLFRLIGFGFVFLTLTVLSGMVFSEQVFGLAVKWDHKTVFTLMSWILFGLLLAGRQWRGWRGKTALSFTLAGFATLLLAYVGSRFVLEVLLHRSA